MACTPGSLWLATATIAAIGMRAAADGPGHLAMSRPFSGATGHLERPFERYQAIGRCGLGDILSSLAPLLLIKRDGTLAAIGAEGAPFAEIPADTGRVRRAAMSLSGGAAIREDGNLVRWPPNPGMPQLPAGPWLDLDASGSHLAALAVDGTVAVWNATQLVPNTGTARGARQLSLAYRFGATLDGNGMISAFGWGSEPAPALPSLPPLRMVRFPLSGEPAASIRRGVAIRSDGALIGVELPFSASTPSGYVDVHVSRASGNGGARIAALRHDGTVDEFAEVATGWNPVPTQWYGRYDSIMLTNLNRQIGVWASDTDRDGRDDAIQIAAGEIPDWNGDLIDDRLQLGSPVHDGDGNGRIDAQDSATICGNRSASVSAWLFTTGIASAGCVECLRVPHGTGIVTSVSLLASRVFGLQPTSTEATFGIWRDPNKDGSPEDAVLLSATTVQLEAPPEGQPASRRLEFAVNPVAVGDPGDVIFVGFVQNGTVPLALMPVREEPGPSDLSNCHLDAAVWYAWMPGTGHDPTALVRRATPLLVASEFLLGWRTRGKIALGWGERRAGDCDSNGTFDPAQEVHAYLYDANSDGIIDACEGDCDFDGEPDIAEILAGAEDCNRDLRPDACQASSSSFVMTAAVPVPGEVAEFQSGPIGVPVATVKVAVSVVGDFSSPTEFVTLQVGELQPRQVGDPDAPDCSVSASSFGVSFTQAEWASAIQDGRIRMRVRSSAFVDPTTCANGSVRVSFNYRSSPADCDNDGVVDRCERFSPDDCNGNAEADSCERDAGAADVDGDGRLDECQVDCDRDGVPDDYRLVSDPGVDCDSNGLIDACEGGDCDSDGIPDRCEVLGGAVDCNADAVPDACQESLDCDQNGTIDACEDQEDCDGDGRTDACQIVAAAPGGEDKDGDLRLDTCEYGRGDFNLDDRIDGQDLAFVLSTWGTNSSLADLNRDGIVTGADLALLLGRWGDLY